MQPIGVGAKAARAAGGAEVPQLERAIDSGGEEELVSGERGVGMG